MKRNAIVSCLLTLLVVIFFRLPAARSDSDFNGAQPSPSCTPVPSPSPILGVTLDSVDDLPAIMGALQELALIRRPTARIVLDENVKLKVYADAISQIRETNNLADVMGEIADSESMHKYASVKDYQGRVTKYLTALPDVDIWEIGNEVNGEWVGWKSKQAERKTPEERKAKRELVGKQVSAAFAIARDRHKKTALTLYYKGDCTKDCLELDGRAYDMFNWLNENLNDAGLRACLDYLLVSFYEDDCEVLSHDPDEDSRRWVEVFKNLSKLFPNSRVGFGEFAPQCKYPECNYDPHNEESPQRNRTCPKCIADQKEFLPRYYRAYDKAIKAEVPAYIGGYFYWYFRQDMPGKPGLKFLEDALASP